MRKVQAFPFFAASDSDVQWGKWSVNGSEDDSFESLMDEWPPSPSVSFEIGAKVSDRFFENVHVQDRELYSLVIEAYCPGTRYLVHETSGFRSRNAGTLVTSVSVDASKVIGEIQLTATICGPGYVSDDQSVPAVPFARLATNTTKILARGDSAIIPTREVEGLESPWEIHVSFQELTDRYQHHINPRLNASEKKLIRDLNAGDKVLQWALVCDVIRTTIQAASSLASDDLNEVDDCAVEYPESLAAAVARYAKMMDSNWTSADLLRAYRDPSNFVEIENKIKKAVKKNVR